jgi:preprotein translocase subunit SecD
MSKALSAVRAAAVVVIAGAMLLGGCSSGADSSAGAHTVAVVDVQPVEGSTTPNLPDVASRLGQLLSAMGFADAQADVTGSTQVTVTVAGAVPVSQLQAALEPGPLLFRKVLNTGPDTSKGTVPTAPAGVASADVTLDSVKAAVGNPAWAAALLLSAAPPAASELNADRSVINALAPFARLTPSQVAVLPAAIQFYVPQIGCATLNGRPRGVTDNPQTTVVVCDTKSVKYLLDVAKVSGSDVASASSAADTSSGSPSWRVDITFSPTGTRLWTVLTGEAFNNTGGRCILTQAAATAGHAPVCEVAVVQDNKVLTAPAIQAVLSSQAQLSGSFSQKQAMTLAAQLALAGLPVRISVLSVTG